MTTMYTPDHEWINIEDHEAAAVGITHHAQEALGDVVFVELPEVGRSYKKGDIAGVVESVKAAADIYMPVSGEIVAMQVHSEGGVVARAAPPGWKRWRCSGPRKGIQCLTGSNPPCTSR